MYRQGKKRRNQYTRNVGKKKKRKKRTTSEDLFHRIRNKNGKERN